MEFSMRNPSEWGRQQFQSSSPFTSHQNPKIPISNTPNNNHQNFRWVSRNRVSQPQIVEKSEVGSSNSSQIRCEEEERDRDFGDRNTNFSTNIGCDEEEKMKEEEFGGDRIEEGVDKIGSVLEELVLGGEELELEEEVLKINDQLQEDELLAMESIHGDNIFIFEKYNGLRYFQIHVHIEALGGLLISTNPNSSKDLETDINRTHELLHSFKVDYLPPIILTCILPKSYPSCLPPYFTISVPWLESLKVSNLCSMLDSIWKEQPPREVIYEWGEWLHSSSLSFLGFDQEMTLGPYGVRHTGDKRAISGCVSPYADITSLERYNEERSHEIFCKNLHECCICFSEYTGTDFLRLPCQHFFCLKCMKTFSEVHVKEGTLHKLLCPDTKCGQMIPSYMLKRLLDDEQFGRWESLMLQKTLDKMSDVVYCPRCQTACILDEDKHAQCSKCFYSFCPLCKDRRHVGLACLSTETKLRDLQERQTSVQKKKPTPHEIKLEQELQSMDEIHRIAKLCPCCKVAISRSVGSCNHMVCSNCGTNFCYRCTMAVTNSYSHFGYYGNGSCPLSSDDKDLNERLQKKAAAIASLYGQQCPNCRQINIKFDENNHIVCLRCSKSFCYLCVKLIRNKRAADHFKPNGCKQLTPLVHSPSLEQTLKSVEEEEEEIGE